MAVGEHSYLRLALLLGRRRRRKCGRGGGGGGGGQKGYLQSASD